MPTLSLFNCKDNEYIYFSAKQAKKTDQRKGFQLSFKIKSR